MTQNQKDSITKMRENGYSYSQIAGELGLNENTIKTFCRRNGLTAAQPAVSVEVPIKPCRQCNKPVIQYPGRKEKKFCSNECRIKWWNAQMRGNGSDGMSDYVCPTCGRTFSAYGSRNRKYCCHECYIIGRFGGGQ